MKRLDRILVGCLMLGVAGCTAITGVVPTSTTTTTTTQSAALNPAQKIVFQARAPYDAAFLVPAATYSALPACGSAGASSACSNPSVVAQLRKADAAAKAAFDAAEEMAARSPNTDAATLLADVNSAATAAETIITTYGIQ